MLFLRVMWYQVLHMQQHQTQSLESVSFNWVLCSSSIFTLSCSYTNLNTFTRSRPSLMSTCWSKCSVTPHFCCTESESFFHPFDSSYHLRPGAVVALSLQACFPHSLPVPSRYPALASPYSATHTFASAYSHVCLLDVPVQWDTWWPIHFSWSLGLLSPGHLTGKLH